MLAKRGLNASAEDGFSLIELLVVLIVIGILAAIALPGFLNQRTKAYDAAAKSNIKTAAYAEEAYSSDHDGTYADDTLGPSDTSGPLAKEEPRLENSPFVTATANGTTGYTLVATAAAAGSVPETYTYIQSSGAIFRSCSPSAGGCVSSTW